MTSDSPSPPGNGVEDARGTVAYIASLTGELSQLAKAHRFDTLGYLLDMARMEANELEKGWHGGHRPGRPQDPGG